MRKGAQTLVFESKPVILSHAAIGGKKEGEGPLAAYFDFLGKDAKLSQKTFEKAESKLQELALDTAKRKLGVSYEDIDVLFAGDLLNQCISSSFAARGTSIPFLGLYGACSTMAESLLLAAAFVDAGFARTAAALTSSHFASAERQYRFPLGYGGQRTPTAQWTVTGSGCCIVGGSGSGVRIEAATIGRVQDLGIKDANNMGAAMAPAAIDTLQAHFRDLRRVPQDYDLIVTGDLGALGKKIVLDQFQRVGVDLTPVYDDCGVLIYDPKRQDVHAGGSGCGCGASVLCGYLLDRLEKRELRRLLFCATGALLSPASAMPWRSRRKEGKAMDYLKAFVIGGAICMLGQVLIDLTRLTPARILVCYVVLGVILGGAGVYEKLVEFAGAGATVPLTGFGNTLAKGVREAVQEQGILGALTGGLKASAAGIAAAVFFGFLAALVCSPKDKS